MAQSTRVTYNSIIFTLPCDVHSVEIKVSKNLSPIAARLLEK